MMWYQSDTVRFMAMTLRLNKEEHEALRDRAVTEGISMQEAACKAVREYLIRVGHETRVGDASERIRGEHQNALTQLGE